jgi:hypothetical protein
MLDISAVNFTFFNSDMSIVELLDWIIIFLRNRNGVEPRAKFLTPEERGIVFPWITFLTNGNVMISSTNKSCKISNRNIRSSTCRGHGCKSWWWYRGPHRLRQRDKGLRTIRDHSRSMLRLILRTSS